MSTDEDDLGSETDEVTGHVRHTLNPQEQDDDVEGHARARLTDDQDDVEGHAVRRPQVHPRADDGDDDVEGHNLHRAKL